MPQLHALKEDDFVTMSVVPHSQHVRPTVRKANKSFGHFANTRSRVNDVAHGFNSLPPPVIRGEGYTPLMVHNGWVHREK